MTRSRHRISGGSLLCRFRRPAFAIDTNINDLISTNLPWRQQQAAYQKAFPGAETMILAVIDAPTAELAQRAADRPKRLKERHDWIQGANEGNDSLFFRRNGLLYLPEPELTATLNQLSRSGPLLIRITTPSPPSGGVAFKIYYIVAWRQGQTDLLASPLTRAVFFSGLTTAVAFGSLWMSNHPGTSSMGQLLALSLACTMVAAILFQPLLMGPPRKKVEPSPVPEKEASLQQ